MLRPILSVKSLCLVVGLSMGVGAIARAESFPNPEYTSWAKCKPGASVKIVGNTEAMGNKSTQTITTKLVELTPEKAVVETSVNVQVMGQTMNQPAQKREIKATVATDPTKVPATPPKMPEGVKTSDPKTGEETITVAGKSYACKTMETNMEQGGMKTLSKIWTSTDVPGSMVKMEATTSGQMASTTKMELVEFKDGN